MKAYLDNAASTNVTEEVFEAMKPYFMSEFGNPSSLHYKGISNRKIINQSKKVIASILNCDYKEIYFTSCGTESINWALKGLAFKNKTKNEIITTRIEHHATLHTCDFLERNGFIIHYLDVDSNGFIDLDQLNALISDNTLVVSVIYANNEIGTIQNIEEIKTICEMHSTYLHLDAVQVATHIPLDLKAVGADLVSISGHKFHAPKGIGMLYIKEGTQLENILHGGQQEFSKRSGTENVPYIVGFTKALALGSKNIESNSKKLRGYATYLLDELTKNGIDFKLNGPEIGENRLPGNLNISFKDMDGGNITFYLNKADIYVSTGSACDSNSINPSHVLRAINVPNEFIYSTIRISFSDFTTLEEVKYATKTLIKILKEG